MNTFDMRQLARGYGLILPPMTEEPIRAHE